MSAATAAASLRVVTGDQTLEGAWASQQWDAAALGIPARRGRGRARFDTIGQLWLRDPVKRWSRFRLATGCATTTISAGALALSRFSRFLTESHPEVDAGPAITRPVLEDFLAWLLEQNYSASTRALTCSMIRVFFDACHRHGWLVGLAPAATIYVDELPFHHEDLARFIPELVMAQIESDEALALMRPATARNLLVVIIETGLRGGEACNLAFNPVLNDSSGWPCLRFDATKVRAEQLVPLSAKAAATIAAQQDHVRTVFPGGSAWLFPGIADNDDGSKPYSHANIARQLHRWCNTIGLHDETGAPITVTAHQFRHTFGTRLINSGVPQHIVQRLLHRSPRMTLVYARIADTVVADQYFNATRAVEADALTTAPAHDDEHGDVACHRRLLGNGHCTRPLELDCRFQTICEGCGFFDTDVEFVDILRRQRDDAADHVDLARTQLYDDIVRVIDEQGDTPSH